MIEVAGHVLGDLGGELDRGLVGDLEDVVDGELLRLLGDGVEDLLAAVADVHGPEAGEGVDVGLAGRVVDDRPLGMIHDHGVEALHLREGGPQVAEKVLLKCLVFALLRQVCHWVLPCRPLVTAPSPRWAGNGRRSGRL